MNMDDALEAGKSLIKDMNTTLSSLEIKDKMENLNLDKLMNNSIERSYERGILGNLTSEDSKISNNHTRQHSYSTRSRPPSNRSFVGVESTSNLTNNINNADQDYEQNEKLLSFLKFQLDNCGKNASE